MDILKAIVLAIVEGITEFLPVSSTGHLILFNEFVNLEPEAFANAFSIIIQLGAILSVVVIYFERLNPFTIKKMPAGKIPAKYDQFNRQTKIHFALTHGDPKTLRLWAKVIVAVLPAVVLGLLFDDYIDEHFMNSTTVAITLFVYGVAIIALETYNAKRHPRYESADSLTFQTAFLIGCFQCLALVPGTSRSAATIIGAMLLGASRTAAADFSFFLAIPTMIGATGLKIFKNLSGFSLFQWFVILVGFVVAFVVAYVVIKKFLAYIQKHDFKIFGYYRIALAILVALYFAFLG